MPRLTTPGKPTETRSKFGRRARNFRDAQDGVRSGNGGSDDAFALAERLAGRRQQHGLDAEPPMSMESVTGDAWEAEGFGAEGRGFGCHQE